MCLKKLEDETGITDGCKPLSRVLRTEASSSGRKPVFLIAEQSLIATPTKDLVNFYYLCF